MKKKKNFPGDGNLFCSNEVGSWTRAGQQKEQARIRNLELHPHPTSSREGRRVGNRVHDWPCLCEEASIKSPKCGAGGASAGEHAKMLGEWLACRGHEALGSFPSTLSYTSLPLGCSSVPLIISIYNKPANSKKTLFPSLLSCSSKLIQPKRGSWEPPTYSRSVRSAGDNLDSRRTVSEWSWIAGHPAGVAENCSWWRKPSTHVWGQKWYERGQKASAKETHGGGCHGGHRRLFKMGCSPRTPKLRWAGKMGAHLNGSIFFLQCSSKPEETRQRLMCK